MMSVRYYCDCCGKEVRSSENLYNLYTTTEKKELCAACYTDIVGKMLERFNERKENLKPTE